MSTASCLPAERPWRGKVVVELIKGDGPLADLAIGLASDLGAPLRNRTVDLLLTIERQEGRWRS